MRASPGHITQHSRHGGRNREAGARHSIDHDGWQKAASGEEATKSSTAGTNATSTASSGASTETAAPAPRAAATTMSSDGTNATASNAESDGVGPTTTQAKIGSEEVRQDATKSVQQSAS